MKKDLWHLIKVTTNRALALGALHSIETTNHLVKSNGNNYLIRQLKKSETTFERNLDKKNQSSGPDSKNPFLEPEKELTVAPIGKKHLGILNKFNICPYHMLIITRKFEKQENILTKKDLQAAYQTLQTTESLIFYNSGKKAGASQKHRHLQWIPLPMDPQLLEAPLDKQMPQEAYFINHSEIPFNHGGFLLKKNTMPLHLIYRQYKKLLKDLKLRTFLSPQTAPHNIIMTNKYFIVIPRRQECFNNISINALGFAGSLFVHSPEELQEMLNYGIENVLNEVAFPNPNYAFRHDLGY